MTTRATRVEDLDLSGFRVLPDRSVQLLEPRDRIVRAGVVATVRDVVHSRGGRRVVHFDNAPSMTVSSPLWADETTTIYRPRTGF